MPEGDPVILITDERIATLTERLETIEAEQRCTPAEASKMFCALGFAATQMFGKIGRAKLMS